MGRQHHIFRTDNTGMGRERSSLGRNTPGWNALAAAVLIAAIAAPAPFAPSVQADDGNSWIRFNGKPIDTVATQSYDRAFVREWEANPPRGNGSCSANPPSLLTRKS